MEPKRQRLKDIFEDHELVCGSLIKELPKSKINNKNVRKNIIYLLKNNFKCMDSNSKLKREYDTQLTKDLIIPGYVFKSIKDINNNIFEKNFRDRWGLEILVYEDGSCEGTFESAPVTTLKDEAFIKKAEGQYIQISDKKDVRGVLDSFNNYLTGYYESLFERTLLLLQK